MSQASRKISKQNFVPYVAGEHEHEHEHIVFEIRKSATTKQQHAKIMCKHTTHGDMCTFLLRSLTAAGNASDEF